MTPVASISWAVASILSRNGLVDFRLYDDGADVFLEAWPVGEVDSDAVLISTRSARTEYGIDGYESTVMITVRANTGREQEAYARANVIYLALLSQQTPSVELAGDDIRLTVSGLWPTPPVIQQTDAAGRPMYSMMVRVSHSEPAIPG